MKITDFGPPTGNSLQEQGLIFRGSPIEAKEILDSFILNKQNAIDRRNIRIKLELETLKDYNARE